MVLGREHEAEVADAAVVVVIVVVGARGEDLLAVLGASVFGLGVDVELVVGMIADAGLDAPKVFHVVTAAKDEVGGVDLLAKGHVAAVADKDAWAPVSGGATEVGPDGVEMPAVETIGGGEARERGVGHVAAHGTALVDAVVEKRLEGECVVVPTILEEERVGEVGEGLAVVVGQDGGEVGVDHWLDGEHVGGGADEETEGPVAQLEVHLGNASLTDELCAAGRGSVEESLAHVVLLEECDGDGLEMVANATGVAQLIVASVGVEGGTHVEGACVGHDFLNDHGVPELACEEGAMVPIHVDVGMAEAEVVVGGVGAAGEVALHEGFGVCSEDVGALEGKVDAGGDAEEVHVPAVVDVDARDGVGGLRLGIEEHHFLAASDDLTVVGIEMRIDETVAQNLLGLEDGVLLGEGCGAGGDES